MSASSIQKSYIINYLQMNLNSDNKYISAKFRQDEWKIEVINQSDIPNAEKFIHFQVSLYKTLIDKLRSEVRTIVITSDQAILWKVNQAANALFKRALCNITNHTEAETIRRKLADELEQHLSQNFPRQPLM